MSTTATRVSRLTGWRALAGFMVRRDRARIAVWALSLSLLTAGAMSTLIDTYGDPAARASLEATMDNPALVSITGRNYAPGDYTMGVLMGQQMLVWTLVAVAIMSVLLLVRHTRTEEASGRAELLRAGVVGRHATSVAALTAVGSANVVVALGVTVAVGTSTDPSMDWHGAALYGAAHLVVGMVFTAMTAVCAQISEYPRGVVGMGLAALGAAFVIRGVGDVAGNGLAWLSPLGWGQATHVYHDNRWWPLAVGVVAAGAFALLGMWLSTRRDVGAGLRAPQASPARASAVLTRPATFTLRLQRAMVVSWAAGMALLGMSYGAVLGDIDSFMEQLGDLQDVFGVVEGVDPLVSFQSTIVLVMAVIGSCAAVLSAQRMRSEESEGRLEMLVVAGLTRAQAARTYVTASVVTGTVVMVVAGLGLGLAGMSATGDASLVGSSVLAAVGFAPALWLMSAVTMVVVGWWPRLTGWVWALVAYSFVAVYLRALMGLPESLENFSPFGHVTRYPLEEWSWVPVLTLTALAAGAFTAAVVGFRRRDVHSLA